MEYTYTVLQDRVCVPTDEAVYGPYISLPAFEVQIEVFMRFLPDQARPKGSVCLFPGSSPLQSPSPSRETHTATAMSTISQVKATQLQLGRIVPTQPQPIWTATAISILGVEMAPS